MRKRDTAHGGPRAVLAAVGYDALMRVLSWHMPAPELECVALRGTLCCWCGAGVEAWKKKIKKCGIPEAVIKSAPGHSREADFFHGKI